MKQLLLILAVGNLALAQVDDYHIKQPPGSVQLQTPYGEKTILFDTPDGERPRTYRLQIPIADLKPPVEEVAKAEPAREPTAVTPPAATAPEAPKAAEVPKAPEVAPEPAYDDSDSLILEANRLFNRGDYFTATTKVDQLLRRNPKFTRAWVMKGTLLYTQGFKDLAKNAWEKAYALSDNNDQEVKRLLEKVK